MSYIFENQPVLQPHEVFRFNRVYVALWIALQERNA